MVQGARLSPRRHRAAEAASATKTLTDRLEGLPLPVPWLITGFPWSKRRESGLKNGLGLLMAVSRFMYLIVTLACT
jgi:hypothetical protein